MRMTTWTALICGLAAAGSIAQSCPQSDECVQFVDCVRYADPLLSRAPTPTSDEEEGGRCWGFADDAEACTQSCSDTTAQRREALIDANIDVGPCYAPGPQAEPTRVQRLLAPPVSQPRDEFE